MNDYIVKLKKYCNYDFGYELLGNYIRVRVDDDISYEYDLKRCSISMYERDKRSEVGCWDNRRISDCWFASILKSSFEAGIDYGDSTSYEGAGSLQELNELLKKRFDDSLFSVGLIEEKKLSLICNSGRYQIMYLYNGANRVIEESDDKEYMFGRFYREIVALEFSYRDLKEYIMVFGVEFTEDEYRELLYS